MLAALAGAVNAVAFTVLGQHTAHMSGAASTVGEALGGGTWRLAADAALLLVAFVLGAVSSAWFAADARDPDAVEPRPRAMCVEALLLAAAWGLLRVGPAYALAAAALIAAAMGLQNASVPSRGGAVVRTTHVTGLLTDLGHELGVALRRRRDADAGVRRRLRIHAVLTLLFVSGAVAGTLAVRTLGGDALLVTAAVPLLVAHLGPSRGASDAAVPS